MEKFIFKWNKMVNYFVFNVVRSSCCDKVITKIILLNTKPFSNIKDLL